MEKDKDIISVITDDGVSRMYIAISIGLAVCIAVTAFFAGFFIPKPASAVNSRLDTYKTKDSAYIEKNDEYTSAKRETDALNERLDEARQELDEFNQSRDSLDKITQKNDELTAQKEQLQNELNSKRAVLSALSGKTVNGANSTVTLTSGRYTVGENIISGSYTVTGTGSIVISSSGQAKVNKQLKPDGERFTLSDGEILRIDGSAKLIREE